MFAPEERHILRDALRPAPDERLVHAVGTTFSVDLTAALAVPLAFAGQALGEADDPIAVLDALRSASDRLDVFCQCGVVNTSGKPTELAAFLEPVLHEVQAPQHESGYLFHPKVWVARYETDDEERFRLICATRNLTASTAWDAVVRLDGRASGRRANASNRPVRDLLEALPDMAVRPLEETRRRRIVELASAIGPVEWEIPDAVGRADLVFRTLGLQRVRGVPDPTAGFTGRRMVVVSPFLDDAAVGALADAHDSLVVVSRAEAFEQLDPDLVGRLDCRVVSALAGLQSVDEGADPIEPRSVLGGLHAKVYVGEWGKAARLVVGSANATSAGLYGHNVEFLVEFRGGPKALGVDKLLHDTEGLGSLLETYRPTGGAAPSDEDELLRSLDRVLRVIAATPFTSEVHESGSMFTQTVRTATPLPAAEEGVAVTVEVYGTLGRQQPVADGATTWVFDGLGLTEISAFVVVTAAGTRGATTLRRSTLVRTDLSGAPPTRLDEILAKQFSTTQQFLQFLALLLGIDRGLDLGAAAGEAANLGSWGAAGGGAGLFELLVEAAAQRPRVLDDIGRLVDRLGETERGRAVLPEGFDTLWSAVRAAQPEIMRLP